MLVSNALLFLLRVGAYLIFIGIVVGGGILALKRCYDESAAGVPAAGDCPREE